MCSLHWSLVVIEVDKRKVWILNSAPGTHSQNFACKIFFFLCVLINMMFSNMIWDLNILWICRCIKRLLAAMAKIFNDQDLSTAEIKEVQVSIQRDSFSCGWRTLINADYILQNLFCGEPLISEVIIIYKVLDNFQSDLCILIIFLDCRLECGE